MTNVTAAEARKNLDKLVTQVQESHEPVQITGKHGNAVLVSEDDWLAMQEALHPLSTPEMRESTIEHMPGACKTPEGKAPQDAEYLERLLRRLSLDLHDGPMQTLAAARLRLESLITLADSEEDAEKCRAAACAIDEALVELRLIAMGLGPSALSEQDLDAIIDRYVTESCARTGVEVDLRIDGERPALTHAARIAVFRIVQEALSNVQRHSNATHAEVSLRYEGDAIVCDVSDNGDGFDTGAIDVQSNAHRGLLGMRERAALLGGEVDVESAPGAGTRVRMRIPLWKRD